MRHTGQGSELGEGAGIGDRAGFLGNRVVRLPAGYHAESETAGKAGTRIHAWALVSFTCTKTRS